MTSHHPLQVNEVCKQKCHVTLFTFLRNNFRFVQGVPKTRSVRPASRLQFNLLNDKCRLNVYEIKQ